MLWLHRDAVRTQAKEKGDGLKLPKRVAPPMIELNGKSWANLNKRLVALCQLRTKTSTINRGREYYIEQRFGLILSIHDGQREDDSGQVRRTQAWHFDVSPFGRSTPISPAKSQG